MSQTPQIATTLLPKHCHVPTGAWLHPAERCIPVSEVYCQLAPSGSDCELLNSQKAVLLSVLYSAQGWQIAPADLDSLQPMYQLLTTAAKWKALLRSAEDC